MDIFIRPLKLRVGWVDISAGLPEQSLSPPQPHRWQPVIAGVGHVKATGVIMGPRFLKALVPDQGRLRLCCQLHQTGQRALLSVGS